MGLKKHCQTSKYLTLRSNNLFWSWHLLSSALLWPFGRHQDPSNLGHRDPEILIYDQRTQDLINHYSSSHAKSPLLLNLWECQDVGNANWGRWPRWPPRPQPGWRCTPPGSGSSGSGCLPGSGSPGSDSGGVSPGLMLSTTWWGERTKDLCTAWTTWQKVNPY